MTVRRTLIGCAVALALVGCESFNVGSNPFRPDPKPPTSDDDAYSILLTVAADPNNHVQQARGYKDFLVRELGWKDVFIINKGTQSELYWGRYSSPTDPKAIKNLRKAKAYRTRTGVQPFATAVPVPLPGKDIGPKEWNLRHTSATYTLLVATFKNMPERRYLKRRDRAVRCCTQLRQRGYEAYFFHGPDASHVTIGAFGPEAVDYVLVGGVERSIVRDVRVSELQKEFPHFEINGNTESVPSYDPQTRKIVRKKKPSALIVVPGRKRPHGDTGGGEQSFPP